MENKCGLGKSKGGSGTQATRDVITSSSRTNPLISCPTAHRNTSTRFEHALCEHLRTSMASNRPMRRIERAGMHDSWATTKAGRSGSRIFVRGRQGEAALSVPETRLAPSAVSMFRRTFCEKAEFFLATDHFCRVTHALFHDNIIARLTASGDCQRSQPRVDEN